MSHRVCQRHGPQQPCTCALGNLYRFIEPVVLYLLKRHGPSHGYELAADLSQQALTDAAVERAALYRALKQLEQHDRTPGDPTRWRSSMMIACDHVIKYFTHASGQRLAWRLQDFRVTRGERVLVTGPSGCGKTTLLNLIAGLLRPDSGAITVCGTPVHGLSIAAADRYRGETLGLVFQSFQLLPSLTILNNVLIGARYGRKWAPDEAKQRALRLLDAVGLRDRLHHRPVQLSLGEQQRVAIARALINEPPVLLADEPTASLDRANAERVLDLLFALCGQHAMTLVTVSHDQQIASRFDRTVDLSSCMQQAMQEVNHV